MLIAALAGMALPYAAAEDTAPAAVQAHPEGEIETAPVEIDGQVLFAVRGAASMAPESRASRIRDRIVAVATDPAVRPDTVRSLERNGMTYIMAGDRHLLILTDADARLEQLDRSELARYHVPRIQQAIIDYRAARSAGVLRQAALYSAAATVGAALLLTLLIWLARSLDRALAQRARTRIGSVSLQSLEFVRAERVAAMLRVAVRALAAIAILAVAFFYLDFVLGQFPWTRALSIRLLDLVLEPLGMIGKAILAKIPDLIFLAVLFIIFRFVLRLVRMFFDAVGQGNVKLAGFEREWAGPTYKVARLGIIAFGVVVAYPYIPGSDSAAFKGVSLLLGVLLSIGSSSAIANIIAGYMLIYRRAFKIGDRVQVGDVTGNVSEMRLQVTHIRTLKNEEVTVPNSQILGTHVVNYSALARSRGLILHTEVGIGYETPWRQVEALLRMATERTPGLLREPVPFVLERKLGDFAVNYELNAYCNDADAMGRLYAELHRNILDVFNEYGVQIMTPAYEGDTPQPKVVAKQDWFAPPAIRPSGDVGPRVG
jgi:small-conductance mechanosensitive channel